MNLNFSPNAQRALALARKESDRLGHDYVGTGHLLLGLLRLDEGGALEILVRFDLATREVIRWEVERLLCLAPDGGLEPGRAYTAGVRRVFALAHREACAHGHRYVGSAHFLLGLLLEGKGNAAQTLRSFGFDLEGLREEVQQIGLTPTW